MIKISSTFFLAYFITMTDDNEPARVKGTAVAPIVKRHKNVSTAKRYPIRQPNKHSGRREFGN